jgi:hypothetical protein
MLGLTSLACSTLLGDDDEPAEVTTEPTVRAETTEPSEATAEIEDTPTQRPAEPTEEAPVEQVSPDPEAAEESQVVYFGPQFRPEEDGLQFQNFGRKRGSTVTIEQLNEFMGDDVCSRVDEDGACKPTATAQILLKMINDLRQEGHCVGFTVTSYRLFQDEYRADDFTPGAESTYDIEEDKAILSRIAVDAALQLLPEVNEALVAGTPNEILAALREQDEPVDLIMRSEDGASHSVMAFGLKEGGDDPVSIKVYDSNFPGETKEVWLDPDANSWRYSVDGLDPENDDMAWHGDDDSQTLAFIPLSAYLSQSNTLLDRTIVALTGDTDLLISTDEGQIGRWDGEDINTVPGALLVDSRGAISSKKGNYLLLPAGMAMNAKYKPSKNTNQAETSIRITSPSMSVAVNGVRLKRGDQAQISVRPQQSRISYSSNSKQKPTVKYTYSGQSSSRTRVEGDPQLLFRPLRQEEVESEYLFTFGDLTLESGEKFVLAIDDEERLAVSGDGIAGDSISVAMARLDGDEEQTFAASALAVASEEGAALDFNNWSPETSLEVLVDEDGDGELESVSAVRDEPLSVLVKEAQSAEEILALVGEYGDYMNDEEIEALLSQLSQNELQGDDYGKVLAAFKDAWNLDDDDVLAFLETIELRAQDLGEFFFELELSDEEVALFVDDLDLSAEETAALWSEWEQQVIVDELLEDWWYLGEDTEYLTSYLVDMDLSGDGYADFFEQLYLTEDELFDVFSDLDLGDAELFYLWYELEDEYYYLEDDYFGYYYYEYFDGDEYDEYYEYWYGSY